MSTRLTSLRVSNYRSIGDEVDIELGHLTALVGPNGSGKSNILDVLRFLRDALTVGLEPALTQRLGIQHVGDAIASAKGAQRRQDCRGDRGRRGRVASSTRSSSSPRTRAATASSTALRAQTLSQQDSKRSSLERPCWSVKRGRLVVAPVGLAPTVEDEELTVLGVAAHPSVRPLVTALRAVRVHSLYPHHLSEPQSAGSPTSLEDTGARTGARCCGRCRVSAKEDLVNTMAMVLDDLVDVSVAKRAGGYYNPTFSHRLPGGAVREFAAAQESDGTLRLAGLITALVQDSPAPVLAIEEPELTINPGLLPLLHDQLEATAERTQVIITTHSPDLLDLLDVDEVRVVRRDQGATTVGRVSEHQRDVVRAGLLAPGGLLRAGGFELEGQQQNLFDDVEPIEVIGFPA